jgi:hypothetical protein
LEYPGLPCAAQVAGLLNGTDIASAKTVEEEDEDKKKIGQVPNPAYTAWVSWDQMVVSFLVNSLTPEILAHVLDLDTSAEIWRVITSMCTAQSRARVQHLRSALNNTKKLDMTPFVYFTKMKGFTSELTAMGWVRKERSKGLKYHQRINQGHGYMEACYPCAKIISWLRDFMGFTSSLPNLFGTKGFFFDDVRP